MGKLFSVIDEFLHKSTWKDLFSLKICFLSAGAFLGTLVPRKHKKSAAAITAAIALAAAVPVAIKLFRIILGKENSAREV